MKITSTKFIKGVVGEDEVLRDGIPQVAFIGRSNVGKSTLINTLTGSSVSRTSSFPGRTQEINVFLVNDSFYLVDLPGYGFARMGGLGREKIGDLIDNYLFNNPFEQKLIVMIIDANVGMTDKDISMFEELKEYGKNFIVIANKIDKMNQSESHKQMLEIKAITKDHTVIPFSSKKRAGLEKLIDTIFG